MAGRIRADSSGGRSSWSWTVARCRIPTQRDLLAQDQLRNEFSRKNTCGADALYHQDGVVDAGFRAGLPELECADLLRSLVEVDVRVGVSEAATMAHTFVKVRQESRGGDPLRPYIPTIAYREIVHHHGRWLWAFDLVDGDDVLAERLVRLAPHVCYIGKRGSFVQFYGLSRATELNHQFTQPVQNDRPWSPPPRAHVVSLDDFGPEADLATLSSFTDRSPKRDRHRKFVETIVPMGLVNTGPGFSEYRRD